VPLAAICERGRRDGGRAAQRHNDDGEALAPSLADPAPFSRAA
jgi:hypothetical protein